MNKILYFILVSFSKLPYSVLYGISNFLSFILIYIVPYRKKVILENLRNSFPEKSDKEINKIWKDFTLHFADVLMETLKFFTVSESEISPRLVLEILKLSILILKTTELLFLQLATKVIGSISQHCHSSFLDLILLMLFMLRLEMNFLERKCTIQGLNLV